MKIAMIVYHKNAEQLYPKSWIAQFMHSVLSQTYKQFDIYELEYGGGNFRIFPNSNYESKEFPSFIHGMNYLLDKVFGMGYDYCLNSNVDDYFSLDRVRKQLDYMRRGYDIISSNFTLIENEKPTLTHRFHKLNIHEELSKSHNIICHPVVAYSKDFWKDQRYVPENFPKEDLKLWQRAIEKGKKFVILEDVLCFHRIHNNSVCKSENR